MKRFQLVIRTADTAGRLERTMAGVVRGDRDGLVDLGSPMANGLVLTPTDRPVTTQPA